MTITRTTLLDLPIITTGTESGTWGNVTNNGLTQYLDIAVAGMVALTSSDFTGGALTIATTEGDSDGTNIVNSSAQYATLKTSSLAANSTITAPGSARAYRIINADATYTLTIKASGQTGVTFQPGTTGFVAFNGTDYEIIGVVGPASATDNAVARFDGTTGQIVQNSVVTIADSTGDISGVGTLNATTADLTNLEVTNLKAKDGTAAGSIADSTGVLTITNAPVVSALTASQAVFTTAGKALVSNAITGTGNVVMSTSPTLVTPVLGTPTSGNLSNCTVDGTNQVGYRDLPAVGTKTASYTLATGDVGKYVQVGSGGSITIPDATFAEGDAISIFNNTSGNITITCTITTAYIAGTDSDKASVTLATRGVATILFISSTVCVISGNVS